MMTNGAGVRRYVGARMWVMGVLGAIAAVGLFALSVTPSAQAPAGAAVYTAAQAAAGRTLYTANCAACHMADLAGRNEAPPLASANFMNT